MRALHLSLVLALTPAAFGQAFVDGAAQLPTSPGANNSYTENVDWADVDLDGDFDALFADGGASGNDQNRLWINQGGAQAKPASNPGAGTVTHLQLWYRDPLNTSNQKTSLSDGLEFTACP